MSTSETKFSRRGFLRASAMAAVGMIAASCAQPAPQVIEKPVTVVVEKEVPVEKQVLATVVVEKEVPVEKVVQQTVVVEQEKVVKETVLVKETVAVEKVVTATPEPIKYKEAPMLAELVKAGKLPPVAERLPESPVVVETLDGIGRYGGAWTSLIAKASDTKLNYVYGYSRLVRFDETGTKIVPDLCESFEVQGGAFTFHLRKGLKWSDGVPLTTEDFKFFWEDVTNNTDLKPGGIAVELVLNNTNPTVTFLDDYTFTYTWPTAYRGFLGRVADGYGVEIHKPKHYLQQFHAKYADAAALDKLVKDGGFQNWAALFTARDTWYVCDNPDRPMTQPWLPTMLPPQEKYVFTRNPYFYRVDTEGNQLPYLDELVMLSTDSKLIALKCTAGDADLQNRGLVFGDITLLKDNEAQAGYQVLLWRTDVTSEMSILPNLNAQDTVLRDLMRDKRFRIAMSLGIDRAEINDVLYMGLATPMQSELFPGVPGYNEAWAQAHTAYDPDQANALFDEMGLKWDANHEYRLRPDGATLDLLLEDAGEVPIYADMVELITATWKKIGIKTLLKITERATYRDRMMSGAASVVLSLGGTAGGLNWINFPEGRVPITDAGAYWAPAWGLWYQSKGQQGEEPPDYIKHIQDLGNAWALAATDEEAAAIEAELRQIYADERFEIGTVGMLPLPCVLKSGFNNVPEEAWNLFKLGYFGYTCPEQYWKS